jgi:hypothetical protein
MRLRQNRMAHATELTHRISAASRQRSGDARAPARRPLSVVEVPVSVRYTAATLAKGQRASGALAILVDLFHAFLFAEREALGSEASGASRSGMTREERGR